MSIKSITAKLDNRFGFTKAGSNLRTEIMAGITTFFAMAYILIVNPSILSQSGMEKVGLVSGALSGKAGSPNAEPSS